MTRNHAQSNNRCIAGRRSSDSRAESAEGVEDHQRNQEAPEDHCREEETGSLYEPMQRMSDLG
jgi:hypothetical protein